MSAAELDTLYLHSVQLSGGNIESFLDSVFSFLRRRSDFYTLATAQDSSIGFAPGRAEEIVLAAFHRQWRERHSVDNNAATPPAAECSQGEEEEVSKNSSSQENTPSSVSSALRPPTISLLNGGSCDIYHWQQGWDTVEVEFPLPSLIVSREIEVQFGKDWVTIKIPKLAIEHALMTTNLIKPDECSWQLDKHTINSQRFQSLILCLCKSAGGNWWDAAFAHHLDRYPPPTIVAKRPLHELPEDEKAAAYKVMESHARKTQGLISEEDQVVYDLVREAWDKPDSPFAGQAFDPKILNLPKKE